MNDLDLDSVKEIGKKIKVEIFEKFAEVKEGHPGSILSIFDIVNAMYLGGFAKLRSNIEERDAVIMSKGHAASVQYPYLVRQGIISQVDWDNWPHGDTALRVFANRSIPGIDVTGGSLGHGLGIAAGMAIANKSDSDDDKIKNKNIFVILGEGELYEGSTWEALLFIAHHKLHRIKIILDLNNNTILGHPENCLSLGDIPAKFKAFGFEPKKIDGHDYEQIYSGFDYLLSSQEEKLKVLLADTIKGKGVSFMEDKAESHYWANLDAAKFEQMMKELAQ